ncbi:MAG: Rv3235 family protein [Marmoricola sp.]
MRHRAQPASPPAAVPIAPAQGLLALDFGPAPDFPSRPNLRLVTGDEPELDGFATRFAQTVVEIIGGDRGVHQLMRWTTEEVYDDLQRRSNALQRTTPGDQRRRRLRAQVRSVHLSRPQPDVAEISIHVRHGQRSRAIAARIELIERRWRCTVLEFG